MHGPNIDNFKDVYKSLKKLNISYKITNQKDPASLISFKKRKNSGDKIKKIGTIILKQTLEEIDNLIINEFKKT